MDQLPNEIIQNIFEYCNLKTLLNCLFIKQFKYKPETKLLIKKYIHTSKFYEDFARPFVQYVFSNMSLYEYAANIITSKFRMESYDFCIYEYVIAYGDINIIQDCISKYNIDKGNKMYAIVTENGNNDKIMLIKNLFPEIKPNNFIISYAIKNKHHNTILLLKKEFPYITNVDDSFNSTICYGYLDTLTLLKNIFPNSSCTYEAYRLAALYGNNDAIKFLKKEFPKIKPTFCAFNEAAAYGHNDTLLLLKQEFPDVKYH